MIKHIGYIDRQWGDSPAKEIHGDMGFWFNETPETRTEDIEALVGLSLGYVLGPEAEYNGETCDDEGRFSIYIVMEADIEMDEDDEICWGQVLLETATVKEVHVCATREQAGWIEEQYKGKVKFHYRNGYGKERKVCHPLQYPHLD